MRALNFAFILMLVSLTGVSTTTDLWNKAYDILDQYFSMLGISVDHEVVSKFENDVLEKMSQSIKDYNKGLRVFDLNSEINGMIYEKSKSIVRDAEKCKPYEPLDEALYEALELLVPDSGENSVSKLAKSDLRKFYLEQPELAKELLERVRIDLEDKALHTQDLVKLLESFYYRWIPLARLSEFIKTNAK